MAVIALFAISLGLLACNPASETTTLGNADAVEFNGSSKSNGHTSFFDREAYVLGVLAQEYIKLSKSVEATEAGNEGQRLAVAKEAIHRRLESLPVEQRLIIKSEPWFREIEEELKE